MLNLFNIGCLNLRTFSLLPLKMHYIMHISKMFTGLTDFTAVAVTFHSLTPELQKEVVCTVTTFVHLCLKNCR